MLSHKVTTLSLNQSTQIPYLLHFRNLTYPRRRLDHYEMECTTSAASSIGSQLLFSGILLVGGLSCC